jgi:hypothetical protein
MNSSISFRKKSAFTQHLLTSHINTLLSITLMAVLLYFTRKLREKYLTLRNGIYGPIKFVLHVEPLKKLRNNKFYYKAASCCYFYWVSYEKFTHMGFDLTTNSIQYQTDLLTTIVKLYHSGLYYKRSELHAILFSSGMSKMAIMRIISESTSMSLRS